MVGSIFKGEKRGISTVEYLLTLSSEQSERGWRDIRGREGDIRGREGESIFTTKRKGWRQKERHRDEEMRRCR